MQTPIDFLAAKPTRFQDLGLTGERPPAIGWTALAMFALAVIAYLPAVLGAQFVAFDDNFFFGPHNPEFQAGFLTVLDPSRPIANAYLPVAHASLWFDWWWFEGSPTGPHLVSLALHAVMATVFVRLLGWLRLAWIPAHLAGALFVLHPAMAESVAWVSGRKDLLAGLFIMVALVQTVRYAQQGGLWRVLFAMLCAALAMYSKATAVVLPLMALLVSLASGGRHNRYAVPLLLCAVVVPIAGHHQSIAAAEGTLAAGDFVERLRQVPGAFLHYLQQTFWPTRLNILHPEVATLERFRAALVPAAATLGGLLLVITVLLCGRVQRRLVAAGLLTFLVALLPFNTAWPASSIAAADRYLHLAIPGMAFAVALTATSMFGRVGLIVGLIALLPLGFLAGSRAHDFRTTESLWRSSLAIDGDNAVAHFNLATELMARSPLAPEQVEEIEQHLGAAINAAQYPIHELRARRVLLAFALQRADYEAAASHARGAVAAATAQRERETNPLRLEQVDTLLIEAHLAAFEPLRLVGDQQGAAASHRAAVAVVPDHPEVVAFGALLQLAAVADELRAAKTNVLAAEEPRGLAVDKELSTALAQHPDHPSLLFAQASWDRVRGKVFRALRNYQRTQQLAPDRVEAWLEAARLMRERELYDDAARYAKAGLQYRDDPALRQEWALALIGAGRLDDAIMQLEAYLKERPGDADAGKILANVLVGRAYARLSDTSGSAHEEVLRIIDRALAYNPNESRAHLVLGRVARERRLFATAVEHLEKAHAAMQHVENFDDARDMLADSLRDLGFERLLAKDYIGAGDAWLRFLEVVPAEMETAGVKLQLQALWRRHESAAVAKLELEDPEARDYEGAIVELRRCLLLDPEQHWVSWLLAMALHQRPDVDLTEVDLAELETLCRQGIAWQEQHDVDASQQYYLLSQTQKRRGQLEASRETAATGLARAGEAAKPAVVDALRALAGT